MVLNRTVWGLLLIQSIGLCQIQNGDFELADPNRATEWFTPPKYWEFENYAGLHSEFVPQPEHNQTVDWSIPNPSEGEFFLLLSTGDVQGPGSDNSIERSSAQNVLHAVSGQTLVGSYFFGTCDYYPYEDYASITLEAQDPNDGLRPISLVEIDVGDVGDHQATDGWQTFYHTFNEAQTGQYIIRCEVNDKTDAGYKSYLAIDGLFICEFVPVFGDLNNDCGVDFSDFSIFADSWMSHDPNDPALNDPNIICDPNDYVFDTWNPLCNFEENFSIDPNDLVLLMEHWLENTRQH